MSRNDMDNQSQLYRSCSSIDFKRAFALSRDETGSEGWPITEIRREVRADCVLCSCVVRVFSDIYTIDGVSAVEKIGYHFRAFDSFSIFQYHYDPWESDVIVAIVVGWSPRQHLSREQFREQLLKATSLGLILPLAQRSALQSSENSGYRHMSGRIVKSGSPDFTRIRSWIDDCHSLRPDCHVKCKYVPGDMDFQSRVINCWTRQVVPLTRDLEYLALSYVWGRAIDDENSQTSQTSRIVPFPTPKTIRNAMSIVRSMGKRYRWVDRYCIWQSEDRHLQIQNMHKIYRNALSTIVPVKADSAESGISGVSSPRCKQFRFWTNAGLLVFTFPHISYQLSSSIWLTRGWTYQEAFLSRSCIFFTKDQAYFACRSDYQREAIKRGQTRLGPYVHAEILEPNLLNHADYIDETSRLDLPQCLLYDHVREYTSRSLTLESDGLNAFEGILKSWETKSFWGIISYHSPDRSGFCPEHSELGFALGLAWFDLSKAPGGGPVHRREGFPTWSWVSLVDQIEHTVRNTWVLYPPIGCSTFYVEDENGQRVGIADMYKRTAGSGALLFSKFGKSLFIEANITQVLLQRSREDRGCFVHASNASFRSKTGLSSSRLSVTDVRVVIDEDDAGTLSNIESHPWNAVQLFWEEGEKPIVGRLKEYWMLVDESEPIAHRIGIVSRITLPSYDCLGDIRMQDLEAQRRVIRIE